MRYLCLVYFVPGVTGTLSPEDRAALDRDSGGYDVELDTRGHLICAEALRPAGEAVTVRVRDGQVTTTDGPFAETREVLGGFILIEARDLAEAVTLAAGIPLAKYGSVEVRPIMVFDAPRIGL